MSNELRSVHRRIERLPVWVLPAILVVLVALGSLSPDSFFLHFDTATIDVAASDLAKACWGEPAATLAPILLVAIPTILLGANPLWQMILLTLCSAVMAAALPRVTQIVTGSKRWALLAVLWFICLPAILYYTRMHIGYPLALFTLGVMLYADRRWFWSGIAFGLTIIAHFNFSVPVAAWLVWSTLFAVSGKDRFRSIAPLVCGIALTFLVIEGIDFLFTGHVFGWTRDVIGDALRLSDQQGNSQAWPITHLLNMIGFANGWVNTTLLIIGIAYPMVRRPRVPLMDAIYLTGWSVFGFYSLRVAFGNTFLTPRMFSAIYPLFVITSAFTIMRGLNWFARTKGSGRLIQQWAVAIGAVLISVALIRDAVFAAEGSHTAYPAVAQAMQRAADEHLPVRYYGNFHAAFFYGALYGVEVSIDDPSTEIISGNTRAVLIFDDRIGNGLTILDEVYADPRIDPSDYTITQIPHMPRYRPAAIEDYDVSPAKLNNLITQFRSQQVLARSTLEIWWPKTPRGEFHYRIDKPNYIYYYPGRGCVTPRIYGGDTQNYYDVLGEKFRLIGAKLREGDFGGALEDLAKWISE